MKPIKYLSRCYFSGSNAFAFIENLGNQINSAFFNHNCYSLLGVTWSFSSTSNMSENFQTSSLSGTEGVGGNGIAAYIANQHLQFDLHKHTTELQVYTLQQLKHVTGCVLINEM